MLPAMRFTRRAAYWMTVVTGGYVYAIGLYLSYEGNFWSGLVMLTLGTSIFLSRNRIAEL